MKTRSVLTCQRCGRHDESIRSGYCPSCGGVMTVEYPGDVLKNAKLPDVVLDMWDFKDMLPPVAAKNRISFGEGGTPLRISRNGETVYFKDEAGNPTGSFKDRAVSMCISLAKEDRCAGIVVASSGNGGAATSLYGNASGMDTVVFVPEATPPGKVAQAITYGARVIRVRGNFSKCYQAAEALTKEKNYRNVTTTFLSPGGLEGYKTIALEIFVQMKDVPEYVFIPVGAGPVLYGIYKGFSELVRAGFASRIPKLICAQAAGCAPISEAFLENRPVKGWQNPSSKASAICDPLIGYEQDGDMTVGAIRASYGYALCLTDEEMRETGILLARKEGIFCEISSAASYAAYRRMMKEGRIRDTDRCVMIITGHGLKDSSAYIAEGTDIPLIESIADLKN